jgi:stage II sporulation protein D
VRWTIASRVKIHRGLIAVFLCALAPIPLRSPVLAENAAPDSSVANVRIGVLGLFHPTQVEVRAPAGIALILRTGEKRIVLETSSGISAATVRISGSDVIVSAGTQVIRASKLIVTGRDRKPADFLLAVPEKIVRCYHGILEVSPTAGTLTNVITMDREIAVASVVAAENTPDTPFEALKAQAIAARSYFVAGGSHHYDFDFCDTTHCQFLREPPATGTATARAVTATRDLVLVYDSLPVAAMYTRSCSGRTHTPAELGLSSAAYPYYSVECRYCREHPARWSSQIPGHESATLRASDESARLKTVRRLGWAAVPSNDFVAKAERDQITLEGTGQGHGIGLCQSGAKAMALAGADFQQILGHYYPNTTLETWMGPASRQQHDSRRVVPHP